MVLDVETELGDDNEKKQLKEALKNA